MIFTHDVATLAELRASWASSVAHVKMAQSYRLRQALLRRGWWLVHFFTVEDGLLNAWQNIGSQSWPARRRVAGAPSAFTHTWIALLKARE